MSSKVLIHVGTPKTGTSQLQDVLFANRDLLRRHRVCYPADRFDAHFLAALDLMRLTWGGLEREAVGRWDRLAAEVRAWPGTSIISHEILAAASPTEAARALDSLRRDERTGAEAELHLVISARDLTRQIPAEWQENVKHRSALTYRRFLRQIQDPARTSRVGAWFWSVQELPAILDRWGQGIDPARIHVVTVPPSGSPPDLLWSRFMSAMELADIPLELSDARANPSLGGPETGLLRRVNRAVNPVLDPADYRPLVRELLAHQTLSRRTTSPRLTLPPSLGPWVNELELTWADDLATRGVHVVGALSELVGSVPDGYADPDRPHRRQMLDAGVDAIKALLVENARLRGEVDRLHAELRHAREARDKSITLRAREKAVRGLRSSAPGRVALGAYRAARGKSSRSA